VAVVSIFMTALFGRNLDDDRPHLGPGLVWLPAEQQGRLASLAALLVPYRTAETVERGVAVTREVLGATVHLARARGADPLIVVPHFGVEEETQRALGRDRYGVAPAVGPPPERPRRAHDRGRHRGSAWRALHDRGAGLNGA
jgi:hypothetical protein